jgi:hypothetical protein
MTAALRLFNLLTREIETFHAVHPGEALAVGAASLAVSSAPAGLHGQGRRDEDQLGRQR